MMKGQHFILLSKMPTSFSLRVPKVQSILHHKSRRHDPVKGSKPGTTCNS